MMKHSLNIFIFVLISVSCLENACFSWEKSSPGNTSFLEPQGTTIVAQKYEKILYRYTIRPGDTLWDIAGWALRDSYLWPEMLKYNFIQNPDLIYPGVTLIIPSPDVLERLKAIEDVDEIKRIRDEEEFGAQFRVVEAPEKEVTLTSESPFKAFMERGLVNPLADDFSNTGPATMLELKGRKNITFRYRESKGSNSELYYSEGYKRQESLDLNLSGKINNSIKVTGKFYQSDQQLDETYSLLFSHEQGELFFGDFNAELPDAKNVLSGRQLTGGQLTVDSQSWGGVLLAGAARGVPYYEQFFGNRTQGPYYLKNSQVVAGSERIWVNKKNQQKGVDYNIDYLTGSVTFIKQSIDDVTQVEILYESKSSTQSGTLFGGQGWIKPSDWLKVTASMGYNKNEDQEIMPANTLNARSHTVISTGLAADHPVIGSLKLDWAGSDYLLDDDRMQGQQFYGQGSSTAGPVRIKGHYLRAQPDYRMIGGMDKGTDNLEYGGQVDAKFRPGIFLEGRYDLKDRVINSERELIEQGSGKASLHLSEWPGLTYLYYQLKEKYLSSDLLKDHMTRRHTGTVDYNQDYLVSTLLAERETREGQFSGRNDATTGKLALSLASKNIAWLQGAAAYEYNQVDQAGNSITSVENYIMQKMTVSGTWTPNDQYSLSLDNVWVWDEAYGSTRTLNSKLIARPSKVINLNANYSWETLEQLIGTLNRAVDVQTASGQLTVSPVTGLSLSLLPNYRHSQVHSSRQLVNLNRQDISQLKWAMNNMISHELEARKDHAAIMNLAVEPVLLQSDYHKGLGKYKFNIALSRHLSGHGLISYEESNRSNYNTTHINYDATKGRKRTLETVLKSSPRDQWQIEGNYSLIIDEQYGTNPEPVTRTAYPVSTIN